MRWLVVIASLLLAGAASAQTVFPPMTNNISDLNPERDALTGPVGSFRITATLTDGVDPLSFVDAIGGVPLRIINRVDGFTNSPLSQAIVTNEPGTLRWLTGTLQAGSYWLRSSLVTDEGEQQIFSRYLTVTSSAAASSVSVSATFTNISNITVANDSNVVSLSLVPLIASNGTIGTVMFPWGGINARTGTFETLTISNLNVGGALNAIDDFARTSAVRLLGATMQGGLTNEYGYFGNGAGLTNLAVQGGITNLSLSGGLSGSLVGQLFYLTNTASAAASPFSETAGLITPTNATATLQLERLVVTNRITHGSAMNVNSGTRSSILGGGGNAASFTNFIDGSGTDSIIGAGYDNHIIASPQAMIGAGINNDIRNSSFAHNFGVNNFLNFASQGYMLSSDSRSVTTVAFTVIGGLWGNGATQSVSGVIIGDQNRVNRTTNAFVIGTQGGVSGLTNVVLVSAGGSRYEATSNNQFAVSAVSFLINSNHMLPIIVTNINNDGGTITTQRIQLLGRLL